MMQQKFGFTKVLFALLSVVILVATQLAASLVGGIFFDRPHMVWLGDILFCLIYVASAVLLIKLLCEKLLKISLSDCRAGRVKIKPVWAVSALLLPLLVSAVFLLMPGDFVQNRLGEVTLFSKITTAVLYYGVAPGVVEELVFRGVIMTALEKRWNKTVAVLVPSMAFGILHAVGGGLDFSSILLLFVAGTAVGILFSLVALESGSIWNSALIHAVWNCMMIGGILAIGPFHNPIAVYSYALHTNSTLVTGGNFGIEASVVSVGGYVLFSLLAVILIRKKAKRVLVP